MNKKHIITVIFSVVLVVSVLLLVTVKDNESEKVVFKENQITKEDAALSIVTFGNRIEDKDTYFIQLESLTDVEKKEAMIENDLFMFSQTEFKSESNNSIIQDLVKNKKTVLVYGYQLNLEEVLDKKTDLIPIFEVGSSKPIHTYLYGTGYSEEHKKMIPISVMGNFDEDEMSTYIMKYLHKTYNKKAE